MRILVIDIGGSHVKILATGRRTKREFVSSSGLTPETMVSQVRHLAKDWVFDAISIGYPGRVVRNQPVAEPFNLGKGWAKYDYQRAFGCPVKIINDAAMQAIGSYQGGIMLFLGLGTGLGSALIVDSVVVPMEIAHLPYVKKTYEDFVGERGLKKFGAHKWRKHVNDVINRLAAAFGPDDIVIGGGNAHRLKSLPPRCRLGDNANAFLGGRRLWEKEYLAKSRPRTRV
jgi:polyphosphate glucokinase